MTRYWYDSRTCYIWENLPTCGWLFPCVSCENITGKTIDVVFNTKETTVYICSHCSKKLSSSEIKNLMSFRYIKASC
jgi:hypothetical protein